MIRNKAVIWAVFLSPLILTGLESQAIEPNPMYRESEQKIRQHIESRTQYPILPPVVITGSWGFEVEPYKPVNKDGNPLTPEYIYDPVDNSLFQIK